MGSRFDVNSNGPKNVGARNRLLLLDTPLGNDLLIPQRARSHEALGRLYEYTVDAIAESEIDLRQLISKPVTLWVRCYSAKHTPIHGYVHTARRLGSNGSHTSYQLSFVPWTFFLRHRHDARIWQDKTTEDILWDVFGVYPEARRQFRFELRGEVLPRSYCTQFEADWDFVMRLMEEEGWYLRYEQVPDGSGHCVVITDTVRTLPQAPTKNIAFHRGGTGDEANKIVQWSVTRKVSNNSLTTRTYNYKLPNQVLEASCSVLPEFGQTQPHLEVYEYTGPYINASSHLGHLRAKTRVEGWESEAQRYSAISACRSVRVGEWFTLDDHPAHAGDQAVDRQFVVVGAEWFIENNLPFTATELDFPGCLKPVFDEFTATMLSISTSKSQRSGRCFNRFEVQSRKQEFRLLLEHHKPVMYTQTATVVGPPGEEVYTDNLNRIKVQVHWQRPGQANHTSSCWMRVAYSNAGDGYGAMNVPRIGQEIILTFLNGDPDRPVVTGRLYNNFQLPAWHTDGRLSGTRTKEFQGTGFNQLVFDDNTNQNRVQLYSTKANSQLSLGHLVGQQGNTRRGFYGIGFALSTDYYGGIVAGRGLYLSTFPRAHETGVQLDAREAREQFVAGSTLTQALSAAAAKAGAGELKAQGSLDKFADATQATYDGEIEGHAYRFKSPVLVAASPAGVGLASSAGIHAHAGDALTMSSLKDTNIAAGTNAAVAAADQLSLFANNGGVKMVSANGKIDIHAHRNDLEIIAYKVLRLLSETDCIELFAKKAISICAAGSFLKIDASGITSGTSGTWTAHAAKHEMPGPKTMAMEMNTWAKTNFDEEFIVLNQGTGEPMVNRQFEITREDGTVLHGATDVQGKTGLQKSQLMGNIRLKLLGAIKR